MAVRYNKLWKKLIDKKMSKTQFRMAAEISSATLAKLSKEEPVSMEVMLRICKIFECDISELMEVVPEQK